MTSDSSHPSSNAGGLAPGDGAGEPPCACVALPPDAGETVRRRLGLAPQAELRIAYVPGPGDVVGTFNHWTAGRHDPRVPKIAYSAEFYSLVQALGARATILHLHPGRPLVADPRFEFLEVARPSQGARGIRYHLGELRYAARLARRLRAARPHAVVIASDAPFLTAVLLPRRLRVILSMHNTLWPMGRKPARLVARLRLALRRVLLKGFDAAVCTSTECARQLALLGRPLDQLFVEMPQYLRQWLDRPAGIHTGDRSARRLLFIGRIEHSKGLFDLIDAVDTLAHDHPDVRLRIAGTGSAVMALEERLREAKGQVTYLGLLSAREVHEEIASETGAMRDFG